MTIGDMAPPPLAASWRFVGLRRGGESVRFVRSASGVRAVGMSRGTDLDEGMPWRVAYDIAWDYRWRFRAATVRSAGSVHDFARDDVHGWVVDGIARPEFADCVDLDLQVSCLTNTAPARRAAARRRRLDAPAVYVTSSLDVQRLSQTYRRLPGSGRRFDYDSPDHGFHTVLPFAADGLVELYPFLGRRVASPVARRPSPVARDPAAG